MRTLKFIGYLALVMVAAPFVWVFRRDSFKGEVFAEYDDDDLGDDVDPDDDDPDRFVSGTHAHLRP